MPMPELPPLPDDLVSILNSRKGGFDEMIGLELTVANYERVEAEIPVTRNLHQPFGLVHGGVYAAIVETLASLGTAIHGMARNARVVGLDNSTSFMRGTREGTLHAVGTPISTGRRTHVWQVEITNDEGKLAASGKVRLLVLDAEEKVGGETLDLKTD